MAELFHRFYQSCRVMGQPNPIGEGRLALVLGTQRVLQHGFGLLGITAPEKM